jgi:diketogulonate reductase-like aldo/keto reductase
MSISLKSTVKLRSGAAIPQLGYGVYQARGEECEKGVAEALRVGYTHIDSAQAYRNEKRKSPGRCKKNQADRIVVGDNVSDRSSTYLTTKYMPTHQPHSSSAVYDYLVKSVPKLNKGKSIEDGGYIDLMLIHAPFGGEKGRTENWAALARAQTEGWIKDIGVSNLYVHPS